MAYQTSRRKDELEEECRELGILEKVNNYNTEERVYKDDYIRALRDYYLEKKYNNNPPKSLRLLDNNIISPMLAQRYKVLNEEEKEEIWNSYKWYFEEKYDGVRMLVTYMQGEGFNFYSRNLSVEDHLPISYGDTIWTGEVDEDKIDVDLIVDSELISLNPNINTIVENNKGVVTQTQLDAISTLISMDSDKAIPIQKKDSTELVFVVFDCIYYNGEWLMDKSLIKRRNYLLEALDKLQRAGFNAKLPRSNRSKKKQFYKDIIMNGGEGIIAKNIEYKYIPNSYRRRQGWIKIKRSMSESLSMEEGIGDTIDAWVSGFKRGNEDTKWENYVGALEFSIYVEDLSAQIFEDEEVEPEVKKIAVVSGISDDLRKEITEWDKDGKPKLKKEYYGKVAELDGQCITARNKRLKHARIVRWRPDKDVGQCRIDSSFLDSMIL